MTKTSIEITRDWAESRKRNSIKGSIKIYTYENNVASEPKSGRLL